MSARPPKATRSRRRHDEARRRRRATRPSCLRPAVATRNAECRRGGSSRAPSACRCAAAPGTRGFCRLRPAPRHKQYVMALPLLFLGSAYCLANIIVTVVPCALLGVAIWLAWGGALHWQDLVVLAVSFSSSPVWNHSGLPPSVHPPQLPEQIWPVRALLRGVRLCAVEGPVIEWVCTHRKHHQFSDLPGRPSQPSYRSRRRLARRAPGSAPCAHRMRCFAASIARESEERCSPRTCSPIH